MWELSFRQEGRLTGPRQSYPKIIGVEEKGDFPLNTATVGETGIATDGGAKL